jgi:hypothetical protein
MLNSHGREKRLSHEHNISTDCLQIADTEAVHAHKTRQFVTVVYECNFCVSGYYISSCRYVIDHPAFHLEHDVSEAGFCLNRYS